MTCICDKTRTCIECDEIMAKQSALLSKDKMTAKDFREFDKLQQQLEAICPEIARSPLTN